MVNDVLQPQRCALYAHTAMMLDSHHVCPESWWRAAGKPVASPLTELCPTCHYDTHVAIDGLVRGLDISLVRLRCQGLARQAMVIAAANGLTPAVTL